MEPNFIYRLIDRTAFNASQMDKIIHLTDVNMAAWFHTALMEWEGWNEESR